MGARTRHPDSALFNGVRLAILRLMFTRPSQEYYYRELLTAVGTGQGALQRELTALTQAGILLRLRSGRRTYYRANRDGPVYRELRALFRRLAEHS